MAMVEKNGRLQITVRKLNKKGEARFFVRTSIRPDELSANYYGASFSPLIYPGQTMRARLFLPADAPDSMRAGLYVHDDNSGDNHQAPAQLLTPGAWHDLTFEIPALHNALLSEAGIAVRHLGTPWTGNLLLEWLDWDGTPTFSNDFALERPEYGAISQWTLLRGYWRLEDGAYHGSGAAINESYTGDVDWRDYEVAVTLRPLIGENHLILARVQGARRSYAVGLGADGQLVLYKNEGGYVLKTSTPFAWQHDQSYSISLRGQGNHLTAAVGDVRLEWTDDDAPYLNGSIGVANFAGCHTAYEQFDIGHGDTMPLP